MNNAYLVEILQAYKEKLCTFKSALRAREAESLMKSVKSFHTFTNVLDTATLLVAASGVVQKRQKRVGWLLLTFIFYPARDGKRSHDDEW